MSKPRIKPTGSRNIVGVRVAQLRKERGIKQKDLVAKLQSMGMDICLTSMSRLEGQMRLVQDFELPILARALDVDILWLLGIEQDG